MVVPMSEADDLARRFFAVWADYLTALSADPKTIEPLQHWLTLAADALRHPAGEADAGARSRSAAGAAAAAGASGERDAALAELARRVDELGERVAALEGTARK